MDKATALAKATDAVSVYSQAVYDYGQGSPEAKGAERVVHDTFVVARDYGATDAELRATQRH